MTTMTPLARKSGSNYMPAIRHGDTQVETIWGPPLATKAAALKYARIEIADRYQQANRRQAPHYLEC